jgi:hypothetical protein
MADAAAEASAAEEAATILSKPGNNHHANAKARFTRCTHACNPLPPKGFTY